MQFLARLCLLLGVLWTPLSAFGQSPAPSPAAEIGTPGPLACEDVARRDEDEAVWARWSACERWVWSCIRDGKEANLFARACFVPRSREQFRSRIPYKLRPFIDPDNGMKDNLLSAEFLVGIVTNEGLVGKVPPAGIRIFGAYFKDFINFENVKTSINLVLDGSVFRGDVRMTNFQSRNNLSFDGSNIRGRLMLLRAQLDGSLFIAKGVFDHVDLRDARIGASIDAPDSIFNGLMKLDRARIEGKIDFERAKLTDLSAFDMSVAGFVRFYLADIRARINLTGAKINGDLRIQRLKFGQANVLLRPRCDWDLRGDTKSFFGGRSPDFEGDPALWQKMAAEILRERSKGALIDAGASYLCARQRIPSLHEVVLREMRIGGTLCLIDIEGKIGNWPPKQRYDYGRVRFGAGLVAGIGPAQTVKLVAPEAGAGEPSLRWTRLPDNFVEKVSLDGTEARATVLRWKKPDAGTRQSATKWHAVNFSAGALLIDLDGRPKEHFIDNLDLKSIAFVSSRDLKAARSGFSEEDDDKSICDIAPDPSTVIPPDRKEAHERIVKFFTDDGLNRSNSAQPLTKIVERLQSSGAASTSLKVQLSDYKLRGLCRGSAFAREWEAYARKNGVEGGVPWWQRPVVAWKVAKGLIWNRNNESLFDKVDEARRIVLDGACVPLLGAYKYSVSYGHEPLNIIFYIVAAVLFCWGLLQLDTVSPHNAPEARPPRLGLLYAIDMFNPFSQIQINRQHAKWQPNKRWLQRYMRLHRLIGFIMCIILAIAVYSAGR